MPKYMIEECNDKTLMQHFTLVDDQTKIFENRHINYANKTNESININFVDFKLVCLQREKFRKIYNADLIEFKFSKS